MQKTDNPMELEARVAALEKQVAELNADIRLTLLEIEKSLPEKPEPQHNWNRTAWVLALVNLLLAVVLFGNIYLFYPVQEMWNISPTMLNWLRALWLVIAFVWLLLQLYPLGLLLTQEQEDWKKVSWRNALKVAKIRPGLVLILTLFVLLSALINVIMPAAWLIVTLILLVVIASLAVRSVFDARMA